jgi:DNA-binding transcriptional LysR family regulator
MELRQLQYFAAVARHRNFGRAAEELYVTQSALSQQVRRLEDEVGLALLDRTTHGVELTPAGADLLAASDRIMAEVAAVRAQLDEHAGVRRGSVRIAATPADVGRLPAALAGFHREHPGIQLALRQGTAADVIGLVGRGSVDVALVALAAEGADGLPAGVTATALADDPLWIAFAPDDPLASAAEVSFWELRERPFILPEPGTALREVTMAACAAAGFSPVPRFAVGDPATVRFLVHAGLGIAVIPASWLESPGPSIAAARPSEALAAPRLSLVHAADGLTPAAALLAARLVDELGA